MPISRLVRLMFELWLKRSFVWDRLSLFQAPLFRTITPARMFPMIAANDRIPSDLLHVGPDPVPFLVFRCPRICGFFRAKGGIFYSCTAPKNRQEDGHYNKAADRSKGDAKTQNQSFMSGH